MAVSRSHSKKAPNQNPTDFFKSKPAGGPRGQSTQRVPDKLTGGPMVEKIYGRPDLAKQ